MALVQSTLASACRSIADHVQGAFNGQSVFVLIGSPAMAETDANKTEHRVNFFFHRFEPSGFAADGLPGETAWIRVHCLVTAFSVAEDQISAGENDLRLLGEVIRIFHEKPVLDPIQIGGETFQAQVIFQPLSLEDMNRIWSTQPDIVYRPSIAYEIALVPVVPKVHAVIAPSVGALSLGVSGKLGAPQAAPSDVTRPFAPVTINTESEGWSPQICFVQAGACVDNVAARLGSQELADFLTPSVLVAGAVGAQVTLRWEVWSSQGGWTAAGQPKVVNIPVARIDPDSIPPGAPVLVDLPLQAVAGQALLFAARSYPRASDGVTLEVRSNPLLVIVYQGGP
jgi:hypothetical protein